MLTLKAIRRTVAVVSVGCVWVGGSMVGGGSPRIGEGRVQQLPGCQRGASRPARMVAPFAQASLQPSTAGCSRRMGGDSTSYYLVRAASFVLPPTIVLAQPDELLRFERFGSDSWVLGPDSSLGALVVLSPSITPYITRPAADQVTGRMVIGGIDAVGDRMYLSDRLSQRVLALDKSFGAARILQPGPGTLDDFVVLEDEGLVVAGMVSTAAAVGYPLHLVDEAGTIRRSFGDDASPYFSFHPRAGSFRRLARDGSEVLAAWRSRYQVDRYDSKGKFLNSIARKVEWFPPWGQSRDDEPRSNIPPTIMGVRPDDRGVWITIRTGAPSEGALAGNSRPLGTMTVAEISEQAATHIALLDPASGDLLWSTTMPGVLIASRTATAWLRVTQDATAAVVLERYVVRSASSQAVPHATPPEPAQEVRP